MCVCSRFVCLQYIVCGSMARPDFAELDEFLGQHISMTFLSENVFLNNIPTPKFNPSH